MEDGAGGCRGHTEVLQDLCDLFIFSRKAGTELVDRHTCIISAVGLLLLKRQLTAVSELLQSCQARRVQAERHLSELKNQASSLPRLFPWPGLGERRQALEEARVLQDKTAAMAPVLSDVRKQVKPPKELRFSPQGTVSGHHTDVECFLKDCRAVCNHAGPGLYRSILA